MAPGTWQSIAEQLPSQQLSAVFCLESPTSLCSDIAALWHAGFSGCVSAGAPLKPIAATLSNWPTNASIASKAKKRFCVVFFNGVAQVQLGLR
ncbi:hypothetical protein SAMN02745866_00998 [Alteromonadaceae bacterium Bs31]|nr:hypothetical protein SAMN02745866_00998 [Alteromonadaceae bacterium Bs31]